MGTGRIYSPTNLYQKNESMAVCRFFFGWVWEGEATGLPEFHDQLLLSVIRRIFAKKPSMLPEMTFPGPTSYKSKPSFGILITKDFKYQCDENVL